MNLNDRHQIINNDISGWLNFEKNGTFKKHFCCLKMSMLSAKPVSNTKKLVTRKSKNNKGTKISLLFRIILF